MLWALRQWQHEVSAFVDGDRSDIRASLLARGFKTAGLLDALPRFALAMDMFLQGLRRRLDIRPPTAPDLSDDEEMWLALCGLAQGRFTAPLVSSLSVLLAGDNARRAARRLVVFMADLEQAGLRLSSTASAGHRQLH